MVEEILVIAKIVAQEMVSKEVQKVQIVEAKTLENKICIKTTVEIFK